MTSLDLRVELPSYSHSFQIRVQQESSVYDVKQEIARLCPGNPRPDGQRLVWRGRFLKDEERVAEVWKSPEDSRIVHLAVHPSAWTSTPLSVASPSTSTAPVTPNPPQTSQTPASRQHQLSAYGSHPLSYIMFRHHGALHVLVHGSYPDSGASLRELEPWRSIAIEALRSWGWSWPAVFDEEYPPSDGRGGGVKYERTTIDGAHYLRLATPNATPTSVQAHALKVLSYTLPIIGMTTDPYNYPPVPVSYTVPINTQNNQQLQQLQQFGFQRFRFGQDQGPIPNVMPHDPNNPNGDPLGGAEIRVIPVRALIAPLLMLVFRTLLMMYLFSPSKRPVFSLMLSAYIIYEAWGAFRAVMGGDRDRAQPAGGAAANAARDAAQPNGNAQPGQQGPRAARQGPGGTRGTAGRSQLDILLHHLSDMNLSSEDTMVDSPAQAPPPGIFHKAKTFVGLLLLTLYPALWDHRRAALRRREGRLRTEANVLQAAEGTGAEGEGEVNADEGRARALAEAVARHERRPAWVQEYVRRVQTTEWMEDL
ncbi:hypothetical protein CERSUDRAFT_148805 [Gelatoporia subvermispora B]|uniref:Ubiquitin-like domain-containing protein n=1 Tax=Ceriporiopsis subvermispora (strain B) TaxID=914234 RepID=M2RQ91_CERS8|nr:hypothetical protein CERSUDRAFT_148805 [Gelatoporia subvermispora B]